MRAITRTSSGICYRTGAFASEIILCDNALSRSLRRMWSGKLFGTVIASLLSQAYLVLMPWSRSSYSTAQMAKRKDAIAIRA